MKIACVCPTYKRPLLLGRAIHCFLQQTTKDCELVILDDAGQYHDQCGDRWRLYSTDRRFPTFGEKRNALVGLVPSDCQGILCWDDDDVYWPHAVEATARALKQAPWAQCRTVYETASPGVLMRVPAFGPGRRNWGYGGCWAWRKDAFWAVGGYFHRDTGDDRGVADKLADKYGDSADSSAGREPWYWYNRDPGLLHISDEGHDFWAKRAEYEAELVETIQVGWNGPDIYGYPVQPEEGKRPW